MLILFSPCSFADENAGTNVTIILTNDRHSHLEPFTKGGELSGGIAPFAAIVPTLEKDAGSSLLLSSGDITSGILYKEFGGKPELTCYSLIGYDAAVPGNQEFTYGETLYADSLQYADFPVVCSNLKTADENLADQLQESLIIEKGGISYGLFGFVPPNLHYLANISNKTIVSADVETIAEKTVSDLRGQGADIVILLSHMGVDKDRSLAANVSGIDLIAGGHDHYLINETVQGPDDWTTIIIQDGCYGEYLGLLAFQYTGNGMVNYTFNRLTVNGTGDEDPAIAKIVSDTQADYQSLMQEPYGETSVDIDTRKSTVRREEANSGNLISDAYRAASPGALIGFVQGGGIRGDTIYDKGPLLLADIYEMQPYENELFEIRLSGADLKQTFEISGAGIATENEDPKQGALLQVSGLKVTYDMARHPFMAEYDENGDLISIMNKGDRVTELLVLTDTGYQPIQEDSLYQLVTSAFLVNGGNGYFTLKKAASDWKYDVGITDTEALAEYISKNSPVSPKTQGRIIVNNRVN
ncbi:MAG: bifunctional metallophosphatase/5'-nucleotidase [Methanospirillaceae archaeon]|nr:bifunctional metallophosphatase/5'-nucleotidase [Methanospirillaceae archaeon]